MIKTSVVFDHRGRAKKEKWGPIEVRVTVNRKPYYINTGIRVRKEEWKLGMVMNRADSLELNERLAVIIRKVEAEITACIRDNVPIDVAEIRRRINDVREEMDGSPFMDWINEQVENMPLAEGTRKHYTTLQVRLIEWGKMKKWSDVTVENIIELDMWLHQLTKPQTKAQILAGVPVEYLGDSGVYNYHKCLKKLLYLAEKIGKIDRCPYTRLRGEFSRGDREKVDYLTDEEIQAVRELDLGIGTHLCMVRDLFVMQIFTGMAYVDLMKFSIDDYKLVDGKWVHTSERVKTGVAFVGHLLPPVVEVLERYNMQVPRISNQKYNESLKKIGELANISTPLHSHLARHTFGTYMLSHGVKIENLARMMGHTNITMTQRYAKTLAKDVHADFDMIAEKLTKTEGSHKK